MKLEIIIFGTKMETSSGGNDRILNILLAAAGIMLSVCNAGPIDETNTSYSTCNTGWELCPTTNLCVLSVCKNIDYSTVSYNHQKCQHGQVPCEAADGACMWPCPKESEVGKLTSPIDPNCGTGKILCEFTMSCTTLDECYKQGNETFTEQCNFGTTFCIANGKCVKGGCPNRPFTGPVKSCPPGMDFCLGAKRCVPSGMCEKPNNPISSASTVQCPPWQQFCLKTGTCTNRGGCQTPPPVGQSGFDERCPPNHEFCMTKGTCVPRNTCTRHDSQKPSGQVCPPRQLFCMEMGRCMPLGMCGNADGLSNSQDPGMFECSGGKILCLASGQCVYPNQCTEEREQISPLLSCSFGQVFCMRIGACTTMDRCGNVDQNPDDGVVCPPGKMFCTMSGTCEFADLCGGRPSTVVGGAPGMEVCPPNQVYCLSTGTCKRAGSCQGRPPDSMATMCPRGYIYCLQRGECVSARTGCNGQPKNEIICPHGSAFSIKMGVCMPDLSDGGELQDWLPDLQCPNGTNSSRETFTHSTCLTNHHCPLGFSCCPDPETLHLQCMNTAGEIAQYSLSITCMVIGKDRFSTGLPCEEAEECKAGSVCCEGTCRSLKGVDSCPLKTLYCPLSKSCVAVGTACEKVCNPGQVLCQITNECGSVDSCEFDTTSGAPWTLPGPLMLPLRGNATAKIIDKGISVKNAFSTADGKPEDKAAKFVILNTTTNFGTWYKGNTNELDVDMEISSKTQIRYIPNQGVYQFGYDYLVLLEKDTNITRKLVQLLAPEDPELKIEVKRPKLSTEEDQPKSLPLIEIVNVSVSDDLYWQVWWNAVDLPKEAAKKGALDYAHPSVVAWINLLTKVGRQPKGTRAASPVVDTDPDRGIRIALETPTKMNKALANLAYSVDYGNSWEVMNPMKSVDIPLGPDDDPESIELQFVPSLNSYGNVTYLVSTFSKNKKTKDSKPKKSKNYIMSNDMDHQMKFELEIVPINDAPVPKKSADLTQVPLLEPGKPNTGVEVETYARIFYNDGDEGPMGICVLQATGGMLGQWQYSTDSGASYTDVTKLTASPLPKDIDLAPSHEGIIDIQAMKKQQECDVTSAIRDPKKLASMTNDENFKDCLPKTTPKISGASTPIEGETTAASDFELIDPDSWILSAPQVFNESPRKGDRSAKQTVGQAQFAGFGTGNLNVSTVYPTAEALFLPSTALLRFNPINTSFWDREEALSNTKLMFVAWDMSEVDEGSVEPIWQNISLHSCLEGGSCSNGSISWSPVVISAEWTDCTGQRVISGVPKTYDKCGICGGSDTSCLDCASVLDGSAYLSCGVCVGGSTNKTKDVDCAGKCGNENVLNEDDICVPTSNPVVKFCDGLTNSGAILNKCGVCVLGTTGLPENSGEDECGECSTRNDCFGCDGVAHSNKVLDLCGRCLVPEDETFNECQALEIVSSPMLDVVISRLPPEDSLDYMTVKADVAGVNTKEYKVDNCELSDGSGKKHAMFTVKYWKEKVRAVFLDVTEGEYKFECTFNQKKKNKGVDSIILEANKTVKVVDSSKMKIELTTELAEVESSKETKVNLTILDGEITDEISCFIAFEKVKTKKGKTGKRVEELGTEVTGPSDVTCTIPSGIRPGEAQLGLTQTRALMTLYTASKINVSTVPVTVIAPPPILQEALLDELGAVLTIKFDQNIQTDTECSEIINWSWVDSTKSPEPKCSTKASTLEVRRLRGINISNGTLLELSAKNGIRRKHGSEASAPQAEGTVNVFQPVALDEIQFVLSGDTEACNASDVKAFITNIKGAKIEDVTISWNVTWEPGTINRSQSDTLIAWDSVDRIKANMTKQMTKNGGTMSCPGSEFLPSFEYLIVAKLEAPGMSSEAKGLTVTTAPPGQGLRAYIRGPSQIKADRKNKFKVFPSLCTEGVSIKDLNLQYMWNIEPEGAGWKDKVGREVTIPKNVLRGGMNYTISVKVTDMADPPLKVESELAVTPISQGIEIITTADTLKVGSSSKIKIDASRSKDKDNRYGDLKIKWTCTMEDGSGCFVVGKDSKTDRFERVIDESILTKFKLNLPAQTLPPGRYILTAEVYKEELSNTKDVFVEVAPGNLPVLITQGPGDVVDAQEGVYIKGLASAKANSLVYWDSVDEAGVSYVDISQLPAGQKTKLEKNAFSLEYDLVLPKPGTSEDFEGLQDGTFYKFRLIGENPEGENSFAEVYFRTNDRPADGTFSVTPDKGDALITNFTFTSSGWTDEDEPLTTSFGYKALATTEDSPITWAFSSTDKAVEATFTLTSDAPESTIIPIVKVCDVYGSCTIEESDPVTVSLPDTIPPEILGNMVDDFDGKLEADSTTIEALSTLKAQMSTLEAMDANNYVDVMVLAAENAVQGKTGDLINKMNGDDSVLSGVNDFLSGTIDLFNDVDITDDIFNDIRLLKRKATAKLTGAQLKDYNEDGLANIISLTPTTSEDVVYFPSTDADQDAVRGSPRTSAMQKGENRGHRRNKRQATTTSTTASNTTLKPIAIDVVLTNLRITEKAIYASKGESSETANMEEFLDEVNLYLSGICLSMSFQDDPKNVLNSLVGLRVTKSNLDFAPEKKFTIADSTGNDGDFIRDDSNIRWGPVLEDYKEWYCGRKGDEGEDLPCYGACMATALFKDDYLSAVARTRQPGEFRGPVAQSALLNTETGVEIPVHSLEEKITYLMVLDDYSVPDGKMLKCYGWSGNEWNATICSTGQTFNDGKDVKRKRCFCTSPGYVGVFLVDKPPDTTPDPKPESVTDPAPTTEEVTTTTTTLAPTTVNTGTPPFFGDSKKVKFKIKANYTEVVGERKEEFEDFMTSQLAEKMKVQRRQIRNLTVAPGSILVEFDFVQDPTRISGASPEDLYDHLAELIDSGDLVLKGLNKEDLQVPSQPLDGSGPVTIKPEQAMLPIIIGSVVGAIVLIVIVLICVAAYLKNKKRKDKITPLQQTGTQQPTYSSIHFEQSLDGTAASLAKHRNNTTPSNRSLSSGGTYSDEGIFIERRSTPGSTGVSSGASSADSGRGREVPDAFDYTSPTKEQMERSGPIPEHIVKKIQEEEEALPGTPAGLA